MNENKSSVKMRTDSVFRKKGKYNANFKIMYCGIFDVFKDPDAAV